MDVDSVFSFGTRSALEVFKEASPLIEKEILVKEEENHIELVNEPTLVESVNATVSSWDMERTCSADIASVDMSWTLTYILSYILLSLVIVTGIIASFDEINLIFPVMMEASTRHVPSLSDIIVLQGTVIDSIHQANHMVNAITAEAVCSVIGSSCIA